MKVAVIAKISKGVMVRVMSIMTTVMIILIPIPKSIVTSIDNSNNETAYTRFLLSSHRHHITHNYHR